MKLLFGTAAWALGEAWFAAAALVDRVLAYYPRRWDR